MKKETFDIANYLDQRMDGIELAIINMEKGGNVQDKIKAALTSVMPEELLEIEKIIMNKLKEKQRKLKKEFENLK